MENETNKKTTQSKRLSVFARLMSELGGGVKWH